MSDFIVASMEPEIFWSALASIGTLLAVSVALLAPVWNSYRRYSKIEKLILAEIRGNLKIIRNMRSREDRELPGGLKVSALQNNDALSSHIDLRLWTEYRFDLASVRPDSYESFNQINRFAEAILDAPKDNGPMRMMVTTDEASSFVTAYEKLYPVSK